MKMDKNSLFAIVACVIFFIAYQAYLTHKYPNMGRPPAKVAEAPVDAKPEPQPQTTPPAQTPPTTATPDAVTQEEATKRLTLDELRFETEEAIYKFSQDYSALTSVELKKYQQEKNDELKRYVQLLDSPLKIQGIVRLGDIEGYRGYSAKREGNALTFSRRQGDWLVQQQITIPEKGYSLGIKVSFQNLGAGANELVAGLLTQQNIKIDEAGGFGPASFVAARKTFVMGVDGDRDFEDAASMCDDDDVTSIDTMKLVNEKIDFIGFDMHYFLSVFKPGLGKMSSVMEKTRKLSGGMCPMSLVTFQNMGLVQPGNSIVLDFTGYLGPKDTEILSDHDPAFALTVNYKTLGIDLSFLSRPLLGVIKFFHSIIPNYGVAIILLTICLKILFYPLTRSAAVSMKRMQKLQPEMTKIREKYKSDPQKQQQTLMKFMSVNKANPMKGCLPILPQMPVFFSFYGVLSQAIELRHAELFGWITDLSSADPYLISPLLLGGLMFLQQKITPNPGMDPNQQKIMMMMPVIFTFMMLPLPAGLVLYMIVNTVVSIVQQQWLNKKLSNLEFKVVHV